MKRVLALVLGLAACGHLETHVLALRELPPPAAALPRLFLEGQCPTQPFYETALVQAMAFDTDATEAALSRALAERGQALGCDALVRVSFAVSTSRGHAYGVCVRWSPTRALPDTDAAH